MTAILRSRIQFAIATLMSFLVATNGFDVLARMSVGNEPFSKAASESLYFAAVQPIGTVLLLGPFVAVAWLSVYVEAKSNSVSAWLLFVASVGALGWLYFQGYQSAQHAMLQQKWTAAALSVGMLPFMSIPVLLAVVVIAGVLLAITDRSKRKT